MNTLAAHLLALADAITPDVAVCRFLETHPNQAAVSLEIGQAVAALKRASAEAEKTAPDPLPADLAPVVGRDLLAGPIDDEPVTLAIAAPRSVPSFYAVRAGAEGWEFAGDERGETWTPLARAHHFTSEEAAFAVATPFGGYVSRET